jgi:hypothetical protein
LHLGHHSMLLHVCAGMCVDPNGEYAYLCDSKVCGSDPTFNRELAFHTARTAPKIQQHYAMTASQAWRSSIANRCGDMGIAL